MSAKNKTKPRPQKVLVVCGPTATGKSALAVELARRFCGEIISADSRQIYRGLNIGTGKITAREMQGVPHHLLDVADPRGNRLPGGNLHSGNLRSDNRFSVEDFKRIAQERIAEIAARGHLPILCGGTGFYIQAVVDNITLPDAPPNPRLRKQLEKIAIKKNGSARLFTLLEKLDRQRALTIDRHNTRRVIRAIEIATALGKVPPIKTSTKTGVATERLRPYEPIFIGIDLPTDELRKRIHTRLLARLKRGMIAEARRLHTLPPTGIGLSWKRMNELGLEYRYLALFLQGKAPCRTRAELMEKLSTEIWRYARRQKTWFKRDARIKWFAPDDQQAIYAFAKKKLS
jgi:tRNA dimethylallyltransferase